MTAKLLQRGFSKEVASDVISNVKLEKDEDIEFLLLKKHADKMYTKYKHKYDPFELEMQLKQRLYARGFNFEQIESYLHTLLNDETS